MGGGGSASAQYVAPQAALNLLNQLGPWLSSRFSQQNPAYQGYFTAPQNPWTEMALGGYAGMGQPTGLLAQSNNINSFLGQSPYSGYGYTPQYYNWNYPTQNMQFFQGGQNPATGQSTYGQPSGMANTQAANTTGGTVYYAVNPQAEYAGGGYTPQENYVGPPGRGPAGGGGGSTGGGTNNQTSATGQPYTWNWGTNTLPTSAGGQDYTGQSSWLNQVPQMFGQGLGAAQNWLGNYSDLFNQAMSRGYGQIPDTARGAFESMLTTKGWNDQPIQQAQSALAGLQGSSPGIWGNVGGNLNSIMANGAPVNVTPQWQQMTGAMDIQRDKNLAQAAESYAAGNKRFGSGAANQFGNVGAEAAAQQNALLGQMTQQALEAAANRRLEATGQGAQLGQMQAMLPLQQAEALLGSGVQDRSSWANLLNAASGAAGAYGNLGLNEGQQWLNAANMLGDYGIQGAGLLGNLYNQAGSNLGNLGLQATQMQGNNAQQQWQNEMSRLQALMGGGQQQNQNVNQGLMMQYQDFLNQLQNPYLPYASQLAGIGSMVGNQQSQLPGAIGSGIGAYAALLPLLK